MSSTSPFSSGSSITDTALGNAYPVVKGVYDKLGDISYLVQNVAAVTEAGRSAVTSAQKAALDSNQTAQDREATELNAAQTLADRNAVESITESFGTVQEAIDATVAQANVAVSNAAIALEQAEIAITQAGISTSAAADSVAVKVAAEAARDSINTTGKVFTNAEGTAAGIAATTNGQQFAVMSAGNTKYSVYRNNAGVALFLYTGHTTALLDSVIGNNPAGVPQFYETLVPEWVGKVLAVDLDGRVLAVMADPNIESLGDQVDGLQASVDGLTTTEAQAIFEINDPVENNQILITDNVGRILDIAVRYSSFADLSAVVDALTEVSGLAVTAEIYETLDGTYKVMFCDTDNRIVAGIFTADTASEVISARGTQATLSDRLNHGLTSFGDPIGPAANAWAIRETRMRLRQLALSETCQLVVILIGDSYTQNPARYSNPLAKQLQTQFGSAGVGWVSFAWYGTASGTWTVGTQPTGLDGAARSDLVVPQIIGTWTCSYNTAANNTPSLSKSTSSTPGDYVKFALPSGHNAIQLFYSGDGTGVVKVSYDDGATYGSDIPLSTVGAGNLALTGVPTTSVTVRIAVVLGSVGIAGVDLRSASSGVRVHKLGGSGSSAAQWAAVTTATWAAQIAALNPGLVQIMHGTNDQTSGPAPATFAANIGAIVSNVRTAVQSTDMLIAMPAENQRTTNAYGMPAYAQAAREYALQNDCAFLDLQYYFGSVANHAYDYSWASARKWYASDLIHPVPETGGRVIVDAEYRFLTSN